MLAEKLWGNGAAYAEAWNFGSNEEDAKPVGDALIIAFLLLS